MILLQIMQQLLETKQGQFGVLQALEGSRGQEPMKRKQKAVSATVHSMLRSTLQVADACVMESPLQGLSEPLEHLTSC